MKLPSGIKSIKKSKLIFFFLGITSALWFLFRVIPKPSRATYPCMQASAPILSAFVVYLIGLASTIYIFKKQNRSLLYSRFTLASLFVAIALFSFSSAEQESQLISSDSVYLQANAPIGVAKGIFPGRVAWVMDKNATNENCTNKSGDYWFMAKNTNQLAVDNLLANGIKNISGQATVSSAWDALFKYFNNAHSKGNVGFTKGEKIVIKLNYTTLGNGGRNLNSAMNSTPQLVIALLSQLIDTLKIAQADISIGDPYRGMPNEVYNPCFAKFPDVHYIEGLGTNGREQTEISTNEVYFNSDNNFASRLPQAYVDAAYLINMPCLKTHDAAGITVGAKNHQGSVIGPDQDATGQYMGNYLHYDYPVGGGAANQEMGIYRHIVDYMAHKKLGGNTLVYIVDAIWSGRNWDAVVEKWQMPPFSNDWTSSLFISQDPVAIESVGFDFLYTEYKDYPASHGNKNYPLVNGVQDYIYQAADPANWPKGIQYDPSTSNHSSPVASLGVQEHWNNSIDKQYSRNLGLNTGIELYTMLAPVANSAGIVKQGKNINIFPNPVRDISTLEYSLPANSNVHIELYSITGKLVIKTESVKQFAGFNTMSLSVINYNLGDGIYICRLVTNGKYSDQLTSKIEIKK